MSGYVSNIDYIDNEQRTSFDREAAGQIGQAIFAVVNFIKPLVIGAAKRALISSVVSAGTQYALGVRDNNQLWNAAGRGAALGAIRAGAGGIAGRAPEGLSRTGTILGGPDPMRSGAQALVEAAAPETTTGSIFSSAANGIRQVFGGMNIDSENMKRLSAAVINAAVNGINMGRLNGVVDGQLRELEALRQRDLTAYNQRIAVAQQTLADADRWDPEWYGRMRMADVAGVEAVAGLQAMRNIAVKSGGQLDDGQRKAYMRSQALHTGRSKALAYNQGKVQATGVQNQLRASGAAMLGPDTAGFQNWGARQDTEAGRIRAQTDATNSTAGGFMDALLEDRPKPVTSPDPTADYGNGNEDWTGGWGFGGFGRNN